jgi:DNA repair protein RadD
MTPRPYQQEALDALDAHLRSGKGTAPCVAIPTGGGKSLLIALAITRWQAKHPGLRVCVLQHRKELVQQNSDEMRGIAPDCDICIYAAGLKRYETNHDILYASIDSIYRKAGELKRFDVIIVDEAHRIPLKGEGKYRQFIKGCQRTNPNLVLVGFTATPFRMEGPICHKDHLLQKMVYEANVLDLINDGYLCKLRTRSSKFKPDLSNIRKAGGEYVLKALSDELDTEEIVQEAVKELKMLR